MSLPRAILGIAAAAALASAAAPAQEGGSLGLAPNPPELQKLAFDLAIRRPAEGAADAAPEAPLRFARASSDAKADAKSDLTLPQDAESRPDSKASQDSQATQPAEEKEVGWTFSLAAYPYFVPEERNYVSEVFKADHGWLHLEARYNYEAIDTGSLWAGYNITGGKEFTYAVTPMIGVVGGDTYGGAPGLEVNLGFKGFNFYTEDEYLFDASHSYNNYFYSWTELTWAPADWVRFGIVAQRTQAYDTEGHVQRGPMLGFSFEHIELTSYVFNPGWSDPVWVFSIGFKF